MANSEFFIRNSKFEILMYHRRRVMKRFAFPLLFLAAAIPAHGWTRAADHRIALKGAEMGPPDLRLVIDQYRDEYLRGVDAPIDRATLRTRIEAESHGIVQMIRTNKPMVLVVQRLGMLARLVSEAN